MTTDFRKLRLAGLKKACYDALGWVPDADLLGEAFALARVHFKAEARRREWDTRFVCGHCGSPSAAELAICWACGYLMGDQPDSAREANKRVAAELGIKGAAEMTSIQLAAAVRNAELELHGQQDRELLEIESRDLIAKVHPHLPSGWTTKLATMGTTYCDPRGRRRIHVPRKGLGVLFSVADGALDGLRNVIFLDREERSRRHVGRSNYAYIGDFAREAAMVCVKTFDLHRDG